MTIKEILKLEHFFQMKPFINELAAEYLRLTDRKVCRSCGSDVQFMINTLKNYHMESKFQLTQEFVIYKIKKGSPETISNAVMSDDLAISFLREDAGRIKVFSKFPENWETLVSGQIDIEESIKEVEDEKDCCEDEEEEPCTDCLKKSLEAMKMNDLRKQYSQVKQEAGMTKDAFIQAIIEYKLENI